MRKFYWYLTAYIKKHGWKFFFALALGIGVFSLILPWLLRHVSFYQTYYIGIVGEYSLDNLPDEIQEQLSAGLIMIEDDGTFVPDIAEKVTIENEGLRYRITLPTERYWQDGKLFTADDVNYPLQDIAVSVEGDDLIYDLPTAFAPFPQILAQPLLRHERKLRWKLFPYEELIGLSNSVLVDYQYDANNRYQLSQVTIDDRAEHRRYIYRFYFTQDEALTAFKMGKVDYLFDVTNAAEVDGWHTVTVAERQLDNQYLAVFFNNNDPLLTKNMRQALSYATEKAPPNTTRAIGPIPATSWAYFAGAKSYDKSLDSAVERLLDELPQAPIELTLTTTNQYYDIAQNLKTDWEELGNAAAEACLESNAVNDKSVCEYLRLQVKIHVQQFPDTNNFQLLLIGQEVGADPDQYDLWHSGLGTNFTHYKNTKVDNLLEKGRQTVDPKNRLAIYQEFQQVLLEDPPAIFLWYLASSDIARK